MHMCWTGQAIVLGCGMVGCVGLGGRVGGWWVQGKQDWARKRWEGLKQGGWQVVEGVDEGR